MPTYGGKLPRTCPQCGRLTLRWQSRMHRWKCVTAGCYSVIDKPAVTTAPHKHKSAPAKAGIYRSVDVGRSNQQTGLLAQRYLIGLDQGYVEVDGATKAAIAKEFGVPSSSFDMVQRNRNHTILVEVKGTKRASAKEHFFSVSETEVKAAKKVGPGNYKIVIVYDLDGVPAHEEFTWDELWGRKKSVTIQYSMRLHPRGVKGSPIRGSGQTQKVPLSRF